MAGKFGDRDRDQEVWVPHGAEPGQLRTLAVSLPHIGARKGGTRAGRRGEGQAEEPCKEDEKKARGSKSGQGVSKGV